MKPHKHAELIKAWADGEKIQYFQSDVMHWIDCGDEPKWDVGSEYRIKPKEPLKEGQKEIEKYFNASRHPTGAISLAYRDNEDIRFNANLKLVFDVETGKMIAAEVLK